MQGQNKVVPCTQAQNTAVRRGVGVTLITDIVLYDMLFRI